MFLHSFLKSYLTILLVVSLNINFSSQTDKSQQLVQSSVNFHLKWVYKDYVLPIWLEERLETNHQSKVKHWYKYSSRAFIEQLGKLYY